jgi:hypothetical protein
MRIQSASPSAVYSTTTFMRRIDARLTLASSITLAVLLFILVNLSSAPSSPAPGAEPAVGGLMIGTQAMTTDELARRVRAGKISSIKVIGSHAVVTTTDGQPFTFSVIGAESVLQQLQSLGDTPNELSQVDYSASQPPLDGTPGLLVVVGVPILLFGSAGLYVWRSASRDAGGQLDDAERLRQIRSMQHPERQRRSSA